MTFPKYTDCKNSGVRWLGEIPGHWGVIQSRRLFRQSKERARPGDQQLTASQKYGVISQAEYMERDGHKVVQVMLGEDILKHVERGDFVISMRSFQGGLELSETAGKISSAYVMVRPTSDVVHRSFKYLFKSRSYIQALQSTSNLVRDGQAMRFANFVQVPLPRVPVQEQKAIADVLDKETARIDQLIEKKQRLVKLLGERVKGLADQALNLPREEWERFEHLTNRISRSVDLAQHDELVRLGLYNRGRGLFRKPAADEEGMGASDFYFVEDGDLILSGQFAWEGAVALAFPEERGCVVSHRYPVYRGREGVRSAYLLVLLRSDYGDFILNQASRGSAGRNRPLNTWRLGKEKLPAAPLDLQVACEEAIRSERLLKMKIGASIDRLREYRSALITAAVTGQIDVTRWGQTGEGDKRLDQIQEEMAG
ncbi:hypothetical protein [uncultured Maricaulis sp.]|uniref:restriction endonuclease subunit S n=1 Tax=uncultured Maricaulis sp. TaxID=174710 RepID=UPI0025F87BF6|nr:hypothetical protein [uncultured Maricaulis sp.]